MDSRPGGYEGRKENKMKVKEIRELTGLSQKKFAEMYNIPQRTLESWESGEREPADYLCNLLLRAVKADKEFKLIGHFNTGDEYVETFSNYQELEYIRRKIAENECCRGPELVIGKIPEEFIPKYLKNYIMSSQWAPDYKEEKE